MQTTVTFRHMEPSPQLRDYGLDKLSKLEKYLDTVLDADITFTVDKFRYRTAVVLTSDGFKFTAEQEADDFYSSVDLVVDKLEKQIKRRKDKKKTRGKNSLPPKEYMGVKAEEEILDAFDVDISPRPGNGQGSSLSPAFESSTHILDLPLQQFHLDEAVEKLSQSSLPYLVFVDKQDGGIRLLRYTSSGALELARFHYQSG
ncbi:MAG: ribosome-associated translation inhibitor RaiA [Deltaproteobacteria bacterium]|jgi:putative sigma-54 modulation protein|nr:ribosome-associated translation inhibitor RaiA [Deltaproteobacteria bacterium]